MDLFGQVRQRNLDRVAPLAARMRPTTLDEFAGQKHFLGQGKLLRRMLEADRLTSVIFYGPPGTGKTTLARLIANYTHSHFEQVNAAAIGVKEVRQIIDQARERLAHSALRTVLFLDEIHRFNRSQQDVLLPDVESGQILLVGATTENPFFAVNSPLVSRSQIFQFAPLGEQDIIDLLKRAIADGERGYGKLPLTVDDQALSHWATTSDGDARRALTALEIAVLSLQSEIGAANQQPIHVTLAVAEESIQRKAIVYDATGDEHYDAASALIKSMRGGDPDAAVYWLARMLEAGEDPRFIARRVAILASEDIGNADPRAIQVAAAAYEIVERIGMPEAQLTLGQAVIYMATAPKSNASAMAIWTAMSDVREGRTIPVPIALRDKHYKGATRLGHGEGYKYPHDYPGAVVDQEYLGVDKTYYTPSDRGYEQELTRRLQMRNSPVEDPEKASEVDAAAGEDPVKKHAPPDQPGLSLGDVSEADSTIQNSAASEDDPVVSTEISVVNSPVRDELAENFAAIADPAEGPVGSAQAESDQDVPPRKAKPQRRKKSPPRSAEDEPSE